MQAAIPLSQLWQDGDFNGDGKIDMNDFGIWNNNNEAFVNHALPSLQGTGGTGAPLLRASAGLVSAVPEPSSFLLLAAAAALWGLAKWRRK